VFANNTGPGVNGESAAGIGTEGESSSGSFEGAGVEGESLHHTGSDAAGAFGLTLIYGSGAPNYGVLGYGSLYGIYGQAGNTGLSSTGPGYGVFGQDNAGSTSKDYNAGVTGLSAYGTGIFAEAAGAPTLGLVGTGTPIGLYAVGKTSSNTTVHDYGIVEESDSLGIGAYNTSSYNATIISESGNGLYGDDFIEGIADFDGSPTVPFYVDYTGHGYFAGGLTTPKGSYLRTKGASGAVSTSYGMNATKPELEDVGDGQLVNGRGVVKFDSKLADVIRELGGGHSTIPFEYRVVAKPLRIDGERLASVDTLSASENNPALAGKTMRPERLPVPLSPEQRLKNRIGTEAYAKQMLMMKNRFAATP
jgi:hypothetical protein